MEYLENLFNQAIDLYNVNPYIFLVLYIISIPVYYYGYIQMIKSGYGYYKKNHTDNNFKLNELISDKGFIKGLVINRAAWVMPYAYIIIAGRNLPAWTYILIISWLTITSLLVIRKIKSKVLSVEIN